jgi:hypothetical protein
MASHSKPVKRASVTKVVGLAGMATTAAVVSLTAGAGTAEAKPAANGNPGTPPVLTGHSGFVPTWQKGTFNTATCGSSGTCFVPQSTSPFPTGTTPTNTTPIVANPNGTGLIIGLGNL